MRAYGLEANATGRYWESGDPEERRNKMVIERARKVQTVNGTRKNIKKRNATIAMAAVCVGERRRRRWW